MVVGRESGWKQPRPIAGAAGRDALPPRWNSTMVTGGSRKGERVRAEADTYSSR